MNEMIAQTSSKEQWHAQSTKVVNELHHIKTFIYLLGHWEGSKESNSADAESPFAAIKRKHSTSSLFKNYRIFEATRDVYRSRVEN